MASKKFLAYSCKHVPFHDPKAIAWIISRIREIKPDEVIDLGDGIEADAASKFPSEQRHQLEDEFVEHNKCLRNIRLEAQAANPNVKLRYLPGNHCDNLNEIGRINPKIRSLCDFVKNQSEFADGHWSIPTQYVYDRRKGVYRIGQVGFAHGYECGSNGDEAQSILLGIPYGLIVLGHSHRPTEVTRARKNQIPLPFWYANAGCLRDLKPDYMKRKRSQTWGQACVIGEAMELKSPRVSREWSAHTEIFRLGDDEL